MNQLTAKVDTVMYLEVITWEAISDERKHNAGSNELIFDELISAGMAMSNVMQFV